MNKYFTTQEVAQMCQVSRGSVIRWINEGKILTATTIGGHNRIELKDVRKLLKELRLPVPAEWQSLFPEFPKILIVDDEKIFCDMLEHYIQKTFPDWQVEKTGDGFEAGLKMESWKPDVVILDLMLPGIDGFRVCELIRKRDTFRKVKIIAVSGHDNTAYREKIISLGADEFLPKPFDLTSLKEKLLKNTSFPLGEERRKAS